VIVGGGIIIIYTFLGGFLAVCWTDLVQGALMVVALVVVPTAAYFHVGGSGAISSAMSAKGISLSLFGGVSESGPLMGIMAIVSAMAWGFGYFGQPHILARFMSAKSLLKLNESMVIAIVWVFISLAGAVIVGLIGISMYEGLSGGEQEKVFIYMIQDLLGPWLGGVMLAAILSAIMSTIDSQLLVSSSALTEDFYQKAIKRDASEQEVIWVGRICVIIISVIALVLALKPSDTILGIVAYAWGGFGAAFGPLVLFALFSKKTSWQSALAGMVVGTVVLLLWKELGLGVHMYEIVPGFAANCLTVFLVNSVYGQRDEGIIKQFDSVLEEISGKMRN
ncbi:MAG: sodium/proline symporter, partial [Planctomycetota bacterium]